MISSIFEGVPVVSVRRLSRYVQLRIGNDPKLQRVAVRGEITNYKPKDQSYVHFDLKEGDTLVSCYVSPVAARQLPSALRVGVEATVYGRVAVYDRRSTWQIEVQQVELTGIGALHAIFEDRRRKLEREGLFAEERKRRIPRFPFRIALVSSANAEGARDFVRILRDDSPHIEIRLFPTLVQGREASAEIARAIERAASADVDVVAIVRGGGSYEDLFAFNDEDVVRAIVRSRHPVVSAIGHESDRTLADFAADKAVATPSAAAKLFPKRADLLEAVRNYRRSAERSAERALRGAVSDLRRLTDRPVLREPARHLDARVTRVERDRERLQHAIVRGLEGRLRRLRTFEQRVGQCDPTNRLNRRGERLAVLRANVERSWAPIAARAGFRLQEAKRRVEAAGERALQRHRSRYERPAIALRTLDPEAILQRGYAIVRFGDRVVRDAREVPRGERIVANVAHGALVARVEEHLTDGNQ